MKSKKKMKRKRMKKGMLLAELYRLFTVRRLMTGIFLVAIIAGTEHPNPISNGTKLLPESPSFLNSLSIINAILAI